MTHVLRIEDVLAVIDNDWKTFHTIKDELIEKHYRDDPDRFVRSRLDLQLDRLVARGEIEQRVGRVFIKEMKKYAPKVQYRLAQGGSRNKVFRPQTA